MTYHVGQSIAYETRGETPAGSIETFTFYGTVDAIHGKTVTLRLLTADGQPFPLISVPANSLNLYPSRGSVAPRLMAPAAPGFDARIHGAIAQLNDSVIAMEEGAYLSPEPARRILQALVRDALQEEREKSKP